ncbi:MAG: hypothetical protein WAV10_02165 [Minisyncoccia bacterium]
MNSTSLGVLTFSTVFLTKTFCRIDEYAFHGNDPTTHPDWVKFLKELQTWHPKTIGGVLVLSYKLATASLNEKDNIYAFMLIPKDIKPIEESFSLAKAFSFHKGRKIVDFIKL